jgi:hypothetical protein
MRADGSRAGSGELGDGACAAVCLLSAAGLPWVAAGGRGVAGADGAPRSKASTRVVVRASFTRTERLYVAVMEGSSAFPHDLPALSRAR